MQTAIAYTASISDGQGFILTYWTDDWGTYNGYQAAPSLNQGYNAGVVTLTSVAAAMPVGDPSLTPPHLYYIIRVDNVSSRNGNPAVVTMFDIYNAWQ
ncbi:MAG TPA: hypothetical protein VJO35_18530 [Terriglobales bacterium]|nr:hypothetical protein [Terriglobales bacterium]